MPRRVLLICLSAVIIGFGPSATAASGAVDFQRQIRPILSQNCFLCHGPDEAERKGGLRLDVREDALKPAKSGARAIVPKQPDESELLKRIAHTDPDEVMPPTKSSKKLSQEEINLLKRWVAEGAPYATHWAYEKPVRPPLPNVANKDWPRTGVDYFIAQRLEEEKLSPAPEADRRTLIRRVALDLTGLPPTVEEVNAFLQDTAPDAYDRMVDRMLEKQAFGEHWARMWLDLARYADSAGYADDPLRSIWAYRDYVIKAFNDNKPFDQFTIEQIAGDLLPKPTEEQVVATAFHRNTMTNNEGGTNDEEFRSAAVVDRVNTTAAVWMGTSMACAQCHTHKYDPITHEEYFRFYSFFNNTADADRPDETPVHKFFNREQKKTRDQWQKEVAALEEKLSTPTADLENGFKKWDEEFPRTLKWLAQKPERVAFKREENAKITDDGTVTREETAANETYTIDLPLDGKSFSALRLELSPTDKNDGLLTRVAASITPPRGIVAGRYVRIELPGQDKFLSLAEVQVFSGKENIAGTGEAKQSSTALNGDAKLAIDGKTDGDFNAKSTTHTDKSENPWWELDLKAVHEIGRIAVWNRTDNGLHTRLADFRITILNEQREPVWEKSLKESPNPSLTLNVDGTRQVYLAGAFASSSAEGKNPSAVLAEKSDSQKGWAPADSAAAASITLLADKLWTSQNGSKLTLTIEQRASANSALLSNFRLALVDDTTLPNYAKAPSAILALLNNDASARTAENRTTLLKHYLRHVAPELKAERDQVASLQKKLDEMKPNTVPIFKELASDQRRKTQIQLRGNYLDLGKEVTEGIPAAFSKPEDAMPRDRLALAKWLVSEENPLTARVLVNRFWEQIFGIGLVRTSEEFGAQGDLPSHPELLDWLATEFIAQRWDTKKILKLLVTSAAYRQTSKVSPELAERDPENRLLARGPRFRMSAETIRDQALFIGGFLSPKMYGPSVRPPQPASGLNAAFGSSVDWKTSEGEDRFRRGLYTEWRRTSPYASMTTFDAPNREVCTVRRTRTNTPLQALVTLNDSVYLEAAQGLALRMLRGGSSVADRIRYGFELCVARPPNDREINRLAELFGEAMSDFAKNPDEKAKKIAPTNATDPVEHAAWTTVANVLLNLDETLMKR
jgi:mono/diheme cytochrome c family protein